MTLHRTVNNLLLVALVLLSINARAQQASSPVKITLFNTGTKASFRAISVVNDRVIWASGTEGTVGRSLDAGKTWQWQHTGTCDSCDWRSLTALSQDEAFIMNAGSPARLLHTKDGGKTWEQQYYNAAPAAFFDCLRFSDAAHGFAVGDPLKDHFPILYTYDSGHVWNEYDYTNDNYPEAMEGEAIFAASNSNISPDHDMPRFITGGLQTRLFYAVANRGPAVKSGNATKPAKSKHRTLPASAGSNATTQAPASDANGPAPKQSYLHWSVTPLPILHGKASTGAFAIDFLNKKQGVIVGGDYANDTISTQNIALTTDGGLNWKPATTGPFGFKSGVVFISTKWLAATGTSGTDYSSDGGQNWHNISREGFNTIQKMPSSLRAIVAGAHGKIGMLEISDPGKSK